MTALFQELDGSLRTGHFTQANRTVDKILDLIEGK
jgi:hypothetical protein